MTLGEIAQRIRCRDESVAAAADRVKNFARSGFLPTGNPGTGHRRSYSEIHLLRAAILSEAMTIGIPAVTADKMLKRHSRYVYSGRMFLALTLGAEPTAAARVIIDLDDLCRRIGTPSPRTAGWDLSL